MEISKNTTEILNSNLATRYAIFLELENNKNNITKVKMGINIPFHINYAIKEYVKELHEKKIAELMSIRIPITDYWNEMEKREKIINHSIINNMNTNKAFKGNMEGD